MTVAGAFVQGAVASRRQAFEPMRCENARVVKGGSGVARKRRRGIDASAPGPRERSGLRRVVVKPSSGRPSANVRSTC